MEWLVLIIFMVFFTAAIVGGALVVYFPNSDLTVLAKYENATVLRISFQDQGSFGEPLLGPKEIWTSKYIDHISIILDGYMIDEIPGSKLRTEPYVYPVSSERHDLLIRIYGKDTSLHEHKFMNSMLDRGY